MKFETKLILLSAAAILTIVVLYTVAVLGLFENKSSNETKSEDKLKGTNVEIVESPVGFDVYVRDSLVYEFTQQNCDSNSLETLELLFHAE